MNLDKLGFWGYVRLLLSLGGIVFVWTLPHNPVANDHGTSISEFIANPRATGMMAAFSFVPISLMWEYQDYYIKVIKSDEDNSVIVGSLTMYQIFYGAFLSCTVGLVPNYVHTLCVALFGVSFLIHAILVVKVLEPHNITKLVLLIAVCAFVGLCIVPSNEMIFWATECVAFTGMLLFTPLEIYFFLPKKICEKKSRSRSRSRGGGELRPLMMSQAQIC